MTKKKQITLLLLVLAVLLAAYLGLKAYNDWSYKKEAEKTSENLTVTDLNTDNIRTIRYTDGSDTVAFEKKNGVWYYTADEALPLKQSCAEEAVSSFCGVTGSRKLSHGDSADDYGLSEPSYTVVLTDAKGKETEVDIGNSTGSDYYLTADGGATIYTVSSTILDSLIFDTDSMIQNETFPDIDSPTLNSFTVKQNGKTLVSCSGDDEDLSSYGSELSGISLDTCVNYKAGSQELEQYGLDQKTRKEMTAVYEDSDKEKTQTFYMGTVFTEEDTDYAYMQLEGSEMVYKVFVSDVEKILN
ncbi:DUF4340 domain-containing protein [Anaerovorax odorimutans]|uniref:DUF4340 domain-containing protein n=1 Tax=Anaerovorax odorimutans TaxID=109327 RepID=A0ABT1RR78_9FIRM|nr:DUF4340 domain-containing protein [Anaerovorax odorimutans]MCQ4637391.1 DUF4340 domain-containing protein [Anaerovorax odorimutans]